MLSVSVAVPGAGLTPAPPNTHLRVNAQKAYTQSLQKSGLEPPVRTIWHSLHNEHSEDVAFSCLS